MKVDTTLRMLPTGKLAVAYAITNLSNEAALRPVITSFLSNDANHSDVQRDLAPGAVLPYRFEFDAAGMKPGNYTLVTRIAFADVNGLARKIYAFNDIRHQPEKIGSPAGALTVRITTPGFNIRSPWHRNNRFTISLNSNAAGAVRAMASFYLPDGFNMNEPERFYELPPNGGKDEKIPVHLVEPVAAGSHPYFVVLRHELNGIHYSQTAHGRIEAVSKPVLFKWLVGVLLILALAALIGYWMLKRRRSA